MRERYGVRFFVDDLLVDGYIDLTQLDDDNYKLIIKQIHRTKNVLDKIITKKERIELINLTEMNKDSNITEFLNKY